MELEELAEAGNPTSAVEAKPFESDADREDCPAWVDAYEV